jgi:hypothetical protein
MKSLQIILLFAGILMSSTIHAEEKNVDPKMPLTVRIVPSSTTEKGEHLITLYRQPTQHFYVVVTNKSNEPLRLWREWCSWGYYTLSFAVVDAAGKKVIVTKGSRAWTRNFPDTTTLGPGDHMVFEVTFDKDTWPNAPMPVEAKSHTIKMKAIFSIPADDDTKKHEVWTGEVSSPLKSYTICR